MKPITFDYVFYKWLEAEQTNFEAENYENLAKHKGFNSIAEWRLATALRLGLDKKSWQEITIDNPQETLPQIIIGPYQGWSKFFTNELTTSFAQALEIPEFFDWVKTHNRIPVVAQNFPQQTNLILLRKPDGKFIHIEGAHRMCAVAYGQKISQPVKTGIVTASVADITDAEIPKLLEFLKQGTERQ